MHIGLHIVNFDWPGGGQKLGATLAQIAQTADEVGFYSLWVMDHFFQLGEEYGIVHGPATANMVEGYSTISFMAALTHQIKIGLLVTSNPYREPGALIKTVSTIDVLSGGRAYLGMGAGWFEREAQGLGLSLPATWSERFERLEETLQIAKQMWSRNVVPYHGKYYHLAEPICQPMPISKPHPPIMIGGGGEKKTLRLVAQYADACNFVVGGPVKEFGEVCVPYGWSLPRLKHKLEVLQQRCQEAGRSYDEIEKTVVTYTLLGPGYQSASEVVDFSGELSRLGFTHTILIMPNVYEIEPLRIVGEQIIPQTKSL